jgi:hypothetical protein
MALGKVAAFSLFFVAAQAIFFDVLIETQIKPFFTLRIALGKRAPASTKWASASRWRAE